MGFEDHPIKYVEEDGYEYFELNLGADRAKYLKSVTFALLLNDEDGIPTVLLGEDADTSEDWEEGVFRDNFRGIWGGIDGNLVYWHVMSITDDYILYEVPLRVNGRLYNLTVAYDIEDAEYKMLSARLDESETGGVQARSEELLSPGDVVSTVFFAIDHGDGDAVLFDNETFSIGRNTVFEETPLPDGTYVFMYMMTDYNDNIYYSDMAELVIEDGEVGLIGHSSGSSAGGSAQTRRTFGPYSAVVPSGWLFDDEDEEIVIFTAPDKSAALSILWGDTEGASLRSIARDVSDVLDGNRPEEDEDGDYIFTFKDEAGRDCTAVVMRTGSDYLILLKHGDHPQMEDLLGSLE